MGRTRQAEAAISNLKEKEVIPKKIKNKLKFFFFSVIAFLLLIVLIFIIISPTKLTGFFTGDSKENLQTFSQEINFISNTSSTYELELENPGKLNSVKLNGLIELKNNSEVKIFLNNLLIFDSSKINTNEQVDSTSKITGKATEETQPIEIEQTQESYSETETPLQEESSPSQEESLTENPNTELDESLSLTNNSYSETETPLQEESSPSQEESLTENQTDETNQEKNKTEINETSNSNQFNESYSETETPLQEESSPSQEESLTENQTDENLEILEFSNICEETCNLEKLNLNNSSYNLRIEISGNATLTLESFDYEIFEQIQEIQINLSQEINTTQYPAILGEPVKWKKLISNPENNSIKVELPKEAENISVNKVTYKKNQFNESYSEIETPLQEESSPSQEESLTENIKKEKINTKIEKISKKEKGDTKEYLEISIEDNASFYEIEYQTPAPQAIEEKLSNGKKVKVTSPDEVHYENILAYTELEENLSINDASQIQIFWVEQNTSIPIEKIEDRNLNGIYDYVEWIIPHLSNQTFLITIQPDSSKGKDTYIDEASVNRNYGTSTRLIVNAVDRRRALIEFDLSEITSTANIINANLTLYLASKGTGASIPINIYRINNSWAEGTGNDQITGNGATWDNRSGNESWISAGGDFNPTLIATKNVSSENTFYTWDLTELVENWINGTYPNYGIIIRAGSGDGIWQFSSSEDSNATRRPQLNITYNESTVPVINLVNIPSTIRESENISLTANITDNLEVTNVSIEINNENYSLGQNPRTVSNNILLHPIIKGTIETNQVINYHNTYDNNNETYAGINNVNPLLTVKTPGVSATGQINSVKIKITHSRATYNTTGYVHWANSNGGETSGLIHEFNSTNENPEIIEFDVTSERNWKFEDFNLLTEIHINNSDNILRIHEAWIEVNYTTPASNDLWNITINTSSLSPGNYTYTLFANDSSQNMGIYNGTITILPPLVLMNISMNDADGNFQESEVIIYNAKNQEIEMNSSMTESQLISLEEGEKDIIIIPADTTITQIEYENTTIEEYVEAIIDIDHPEESGNFTTIYALNPYLETNATVKVVATGNELYKCKDWNFSEQNCFGEWIKVMDIIPGEEYNFTLNPEDPGFGEIILITKAEHLSSNKTFISDIYNEIRGLDNIWSETISEDEYIRITFEIPLDSTKDITLYPRIVSGNPRIEVYEFNGTNLIAEFNPIEENRYNTIYLTNLIGEQSTFDLRIVNGSLEFDHILDPSIWVKDLAINASLPDAGSNSTPSVFYKDSSWYILNGNLAGTFNGYVWNGTNWLVNTTINRTMVDIGANSHPSVFYISPTWYFISGMTTGRLYTYQWNGTAFEMNKTMNISLPDLGSNTAPTVFYKDSSWYLISGELGGRFFGYVWNGSSFVKNLTINNSLPDIGALSKPNVFQKDGVYYMLAGESNGEFKGFAWDGTQWLPNSTINASLPDIGGFSTPNVFYKDSAWYMISGENLGRFFGYNYSSDETPPFYSSVSSNNTMLDSITLFSVNVNDNYILNPNGGYIFSTNNTGSWINDSFISFSSTPSWANVTKTLNSTLGTVIGYMWYFNDSAGNTNSTLIYTLTTTEYELQCGILNSADTIYTLTQNLSSTGDCFNIAAVNITLDCDGYSIIGNNNQGAKAINVGTPNATIKNCILKNWSTDLYVENTENTTIKNITGGSEYGLIVNGTSNSNFTDLSFNNISITGILITNNSHNNTFTNIRINSSAHGIYIESGENNTVDCANGLINYSGNGSDYFYGIYTNQFNTTIKNCNVLDGNLGSSGTERHGVYLYTSTYSTLSNCFILGNNSPTISLNEAHFSSIINNTGISGNRAIHLLDTNNTLIKNNTGNSTLNNPGIHVYGTCSNNTFINNTVLSRGYSLFLESNYPTKGTSNNLLINNTLTSTQSTALMFSGSNNNTIINQIAESKAAYAIDLASSANNTFRDCINLTGASQEISLGWDSGSFNNTLINCSYGQEYIPVIENWMLIKWYYQAYVNYSNGNPASNVNITAYNSSGNIEFTAQTNSSGWISRQEVRDYNSTYNGRLYYSNYTLFANKSGTLNDTNILNISLSPNKLNDFFTLEQAGVQCGDSLDIAGNTYTLTSNISSQGTCFDISTDNITLDCNGYWINYSIGGEANTYGVYSYDTTNLTIKNCNIVDGNWSSTTQYSRVGININTVTNSTIFNNTIRTNNSYGIYLYNNAKYNNLTANTVFSNTSLGIILDDNSAYNTLINNTASSNGDAAIFIYQYSDNNTLIGNNGTSRFAGCFIYSSGYNNFSNNTCSNREGIDYGLYLYDAYNNLFENNTAISEIGTPTRIGASLNNTFIQHISIIVGEGYHSVSLDYSTNNTIFKDCVNISGPDYDLIVDTNSINNTLINCSYDSERIDDTFSQIIRKWYYQSYTNYSNGTAVAGANISAYNTTGQLQFTQLTNSSGYINRQEVIEYINTGGTRSYFNNYTINATLSGYETDSNIFNFTLTQNKVDDVFTLQEEFVDVTSPNITLEEPPTPENSSTITTANTTILANISDDNLEGNTSSWIDFDRSLVGYWSMDYYNATGIFDNSTYNNFGTFEGGLNYTNISTGSRGDALTFDGNTTYLSFNDISNMGQHFTISLWSNTLGNGSSNDGGLFFHSYDWGSEGGDGFGIYQYFVATEGESGMYTYARIGNYSTQWNELGTTIEFAPLNTWRNYVIQFDYPYLITYVNGVIMENNSFAYTLNSTWNDFSIGRLWDGVHFNGSLDEVMIFNRSLSQTEISALYNSKINKFNSTFNYLSLGQHNYTVYAIDEAGNYNSSGERNFIVEPDTTYPNVTINSPTGTFADITPLINISISENSDVWYNINNGTNITLCNNCNFSQNKFLYAEEGENIIYIFANDSAGNLNSSIYSSFTIEMNNNYYDNFNDNSSLYSSYNVEFNNGSINFSGEYTYLQDEDLVSVYLFENSENLGLDTIGNNNMSEVGTPTQNTTVPEGFQGYSIQLDGDDQICNHSGFTFNPSTNHTMCFWVMKTGFSNDGNVFAQNCVYDTWDNDAEYIFTANNCYNQESVGIEGVYYLDQWVHICQTYDSTTDNMTFYINGDENSSHVFTNPIEYHADQAWCIGGCDGGCWMTGNVFQPMWFERILNSEEIKDISSQGGFNQGNFTSYPINTSQNITSITNITWTETNTDANNNITVEISADGGLTWYNATSGSELGETFTGENNSLVYRVLFSTNSSTIIAISDMNISWSSEQEIVGENACGTLNSANTVYTLTSNVSSQGTCFNISAANITLDCNNYWINYSINGTGSQYGIYSNMINTTIKNCNIVNGNLTSSSTSQSAIYINNANNVTIFKNYISCNSTSSHGVYSYNSDYGNISNNTILTGGSTVKGIYLNVGSDYNNISRNLINTTGAGSVGIHVQVVGNNNYFHANDVYSRDSPAMHFQGNSNNTILMSMELYSVNQDSLLIMDSNHNLSVFDSILNSTNEYDLRIGWSAGVGIWNFTNVTNSSGDKLFLSFMSNANGVANMFWYFDANVSYSNGTAIESANISIYNTSNNLIYTGLTDSNGDINRLSLLEYSNYNTTATYHTPHTVNVTKEGYVLNSTSYNLTDLQNVFTNIILEEDTSLYCGDALDSANTIYTLTQNVSSQGTCFNISAANITLDCNNYWINYSLGGAANTYGIYSDKFNTTIKNCNIYDGNWTSPNTNRYGIYIYTGDNSTLFNNYINTNNSAAITLDENANYNNLTQNIINTNFINYGWGIYLDSVSSYNNINNNTINSGSNGVFFVGSSFNNIINNNATSKFASGIFIQQSSNNNTLINNTFESIATTGSSTYGVRDVNNFNNTYVNNTAKSVGRSATIISGSSNLTFISHYSTTSGSSGTRYGIWFYSGNNTVFRDCRNISGGTADVNVVDIELNLNNTLINCSYSSEVVGGASNYLIRKWYYQAYANYTNGTAIESANISAYNTTGQLQFTALTNSSGFISRQEVTEYINTGGTRSYYNNYTINATLSGYDTDSNIFNFTTTQNKIDDVFTLEEASLPPQIYSVTPLTPVTLTEGPSPTFLIINFSVYDANGASNLNSSTASINFTKAGEELRYNNSCIQYQSSGNYANYTCNITMWWFDTAGDDWKIYANISDLDSNIAINSSLNFTVNTLTGFATDYSSLNFATLVAGSHNQTPINHFKLNNTGNVDISIGNIEINATDLVGETTHDRFLFAGNFSASPYTGNKIECSLNGSSTQLSNYTFTKVENTLLPSGNYTLNDGTAQEEIYICLREIGIELTQQQYSTDSFGSWTIRIVLVALSIRTRKKKSKSEKKSQLTIPATIFTKKLGALESTVKYMKENLGLTYHTIAEMLNRNERTIWTAYNKSIEKYKETIEVKETEIFIPLSILNNRKLTILESVIVYLRNKDMTYSEIGKLINRDQRNVRSIYISLEQKLKEKQTTTSQLTIPATIFTKKLGALESTVKYMKENLGLTYHTIAEMLNRNERTIWTAYNKSIEKYKETIEVKETEIFIPLSILNNRKLTILESVIVYLRNKDMTYSEIGKLINRDQRNVRDIYFKENNNI